MHTVYETQSDRPYGKKRPALSRLEDQWRHSPSGVEGRLLADQWWDQNETMLHSVSTAPLAAYAQWDSRNDKACPANSFAHPHFAPKQPG